MQKGKILAIDYGGAKVGLAVSDYGRLMAFGRGVLRGKDREKLAEKVARLVKEENISLLLVGLPVGLNGEDTEQTRIIKGFAENLLKDLQKEGIMVSLEYIDESFSSFEAREYLRKIGLKSSEISLSEDEMAAVVLIHRYIDFRP